MLLSNVTLTTLTFYLNSNYSKKTGKLFTISDVQSYVRRGHIPKYLGGDLIELNKDFKDVKLYSLKKNG